MEDQVIGKLAWDVDSEGWVGIVGTPAQGARVYVGSGSAYQYPSEEILALIRVPHCEFEQLSQTALAYLLANSNAGPWSAKPNEFRVTGLESYEHYLPEGTYTITFSNGDSESIWRVNFKERQTIGWGVDD